MSATLIDYTIALGLMIVAFSAAASFAISAAASSQDDVRLSTLQLQAASLLGLTSRDYAFGTSISGLGLANRVTSASQPPTELTIISEAALQRLAAKPYQEIREDFDFRIRLIDRANVTIFDYGGAPALTDVVALQKAVLYESGSEIKPGTFVVEVW